MLRGKGSPYEVRCLRCDVSFPVEAKRCIHCGGPLAASETGALHGVFPGPLETAPAGSGARGSFPIPGSAPTSSPSTQPSPSPGSGPILLPGDPGDPDDAAGERAPSLGASLLRSFGSFFWIIALVAFSLLRNCQAEG